MGALSSEIINCRPVRPPVTALFEICRRELRDALSSRWFLLYSLVFAGLGVGVSYVSASSVAGSGLAGFGRTTAGLINLVLLIVPLMALTAGAGAVASDRERGVLLYLLAQPVARWEVLLGKYLALALAMLASVAIGFGVCASVLAWHDSATDPAKILLLAGLTVLLALSMLSVGVLVSTLVRRTSVAVGTAVFLWLVFVLGTDLGLMAGVTALDLSIETLFGLSLATPLQVFKMWSLQAVDASLDVLGPSGLYAQETLAGSVSQLFLMSLAAWIVTPLVLAGVVFSRRSPV